MLEAAYNGLVLALQWPAIGYLGIGILLGLWFGAVPGLGGLTGMAILLPFTFGMEPVSAFAFLLGMYAVTTTSDTIPSVLMGVPASAAAAATVLDGYPMAKRGEAARAFGAAFTAGALGGILGAVAMGLSIPIVRPLVLSFAKPEFFMLGVLGLAMVGSLSGKSILKGLVSGGLGLLIGMVGYAQQVSIPRYWMGTTYLLDGAPLIPLVLGLFALPEIISLVASNRTISNLPREKVASGILTGVGDVFRHWWLFLRSSILGIYIGILPALGPTVADWVAYGHAVQSEKNKERFGKGDVRGVIAPEAANHSVKGGDLIPTVAFGIPGSAGMAVLMGAFLIQGLTPGPQMLTEKLDITFSMVWTLVIANVVGALLLMACTNQIQKIIFVPGHLVVPAVVLFMFMGAWQGGQIGDWITVLVFCAVGDVMKKGGWPRAPMMLGFILGPIMENSLNLSITAYSWDWIFRPIVLVLFAGVVVTVLLVIRDQQRKRRPDATPAAALDVEAENPLVSLPFSALACIAFGYAVIASIGWPYSVRLFPQAICIPALLLALFALWRDIEAARPILARSGGIGATYLPSAWLDEPARRTLRFYVWLAGIVVVTPVIGQIAALTLFIAAYLLHWGGYWDKKRWWVAAVYAACGALFLYAVFDQVVHVTWYPSLLFG
ncbi:MAG TPA: tripartite tricarboxylate transporter permease [Alphaproteobacteria bacterium]|jgi:TctA family transporter